MSSITVSSIAGRSYFPIWSQLKIRAITFKQHVISESLQVRRNLILSHLKYQNSFCLGSRLTWYLLYVLPLKLPIHTS